MSVAVFHTLILNERSIGESTAEVISLTAGTVEGAVSELLVLQG